MRSATPSAAAKLLLLTALAGAGLLASATAATVYVAGTPQRTSPRDSTVRSAPTLAAALAASRGSYTLRLLADSVVAPLGPEQTADSAVLAHMIALITKRSDSAAFLPYGPSDTTARVALGVYRRWARSEPMEAFWAYREGFPGATNSMALPIISFASLKSLAKHNEDEADSALAQGDVTTALERARENIAASRHLVWQPFPIDALVGRVLLTNGAKLLARSALQANQPDLHSAATRLLELSRSANFFPKTGGQLLGGIGANPNDERLVALAADTAYFPATRMLVIEAMTADLCLSTREVLFGPSRARHKSIDRVIDAMQDIPRVDELRQLSHATLDVFDKTPGFALQPSRDVEPVSEILLRLVVPEPVLARARSCEHAR